VYSAESGGTAYTEASATPNAKSYTVDSTLDNKILFGNVPIGTAYLRITVKDSSGAVKTVTQKFTVSETGTVTPSTSYTQAEIDKYIANVKKCSSIPSDKRDCCSVITQKMLENGMEVAFVAGMLANICSEGDFGLFEKKASWTYQKNMDSKYDYWKKWAGKNIWDVNFTEIYNIVKECNTARWRTDSKGPINIGFGIGCVQWTYDRTYTLFNSFYAVENGGRSTITKDEAIMAECKMIVYELTKVAEFKEVYTNWQSKANRTAYSAGETICVDYEKPTDPDKKKITRGNLATTIFDSIK